MIGLINKKLMFDVPKAVLHIAIPLLLDIYINSRYIHIVHKICSMSPSSPDTCVSVCQNTFFSLFWEPLKVKSHAQVCENSRFPESDTTNKVKA